MHFVFYHLPASSVVVLSVRGLGKYCVQVIVGHFTVGLVIYVGQEQGHTLYDAGDASAPQRQRNVTAEISELSVDGDVDDRCRQDVPQLLG